MEKALLLRGSDELDRALAFVNETVAVLKNQVETSASRGHGCLTDERADLLEWYQQYADRLRSMTVEFDLDLNKYFSRKQAEAVIRWAVRYEEIANAYQKWAEDLGVMIEKWDEKKKKAEARMKKLNTAVLERRVLVDKDDLELARELWPAYRDKPYDGPDVIYRDLSETEVLRLRSELTVAGKQQKYFECLAELGKYEEAWLLIKAEDFRKSSEISAVIGGSEPSALIYAIRNTISTHEVTIKTLERKSGRIDEKNRSLSRSGTLETLDLMEELSRYYETMRTRYENHVEWLRSRVGSYEADFMEISEELSQR